MLSHLNLLTWARELARISSESGIHYLYSSLMCPLENVEFTACQNNCVNARWGSFLNRINVEDYNRWRFCVRVDPIGSGPLELNNRRTTRHIFFIRRI